MTIPRIFHQIWLGSPLPQEFAAYGRTWLEHHPGWALKLWTEDELPQLANQRLYDEAAELTSGSVWQLRSDVARYELLQRHGGVYVDTDFECLQSIEPLIASARAFAAWEEQDTWIANGLMGSTPGHPFLELLIAGLPDSVAAHRQHRPNRSTGPQYMTRMHRQHNGFDLVLAQDLVYPYSYRDLGRYGTDRPNDFAGAYAVHHWQNQRRKRGLL